MRMLRPARNDFDTGSVPRELMFITSDGSQFRGITSGIVIDEETDYYLAGSFDLAGQEATFYAYDLSNNSLQIATVPHSVPNLNPFPTVLISAARRTAWSVLNVRQRTADSLQNSICHRCTPPRTVWRALSFESI